MAARIQPRKRVGVRWASSAPAALLPAAPGEAASFARLVPAWLGDLTLRNYSKATCETWSVSFGLFAAWCAERSITNANQVTRAVVEAYQRHLFYARSGRGRTARGSAHACDAPLAIRTQRSRLHVVKTFYSWAVRRGHVPAHPATDLEYPRRQKPLPDSLSADEVAAILGGCDLSTPGGIRDRAFLEVLYSTGLRRAEAVRLNTDDIDHVRGVVHVILGKGAKDRYVPIGRRALAWLDRYEAEVRAAWCRNAGEFRLFLTDTGRPVSDGLMSGRVHRLLVAAGITKRGACHLFRHTFATQLLENGCDIRLIGAMLGHSDLSSTALYTRVGVSTLVKAHETFHPSSDVSGGQAKPSSG